MRNDEKIICLAPYTVEMFYNLKEKNHKKEKDFEKYLNSKIKNKEYFTAYISKTNKPKEWILEAKNLMQAYSNETNNEKTKILRLLKESKLYFYKRESMYILNLNKTLKHLDNDCLISILNYLSNVDLDLNIYKTLRKNNQINEINFTMTKSSDLGFTSKQEILAHDYLNIKGKEYYYSPRGEVELRKYMIETIFNIGMNKKFIKKEFSNYFKDELKKENLYKYDFISNQRNYYYKHDEIIIIDNDTNYPRKIIKINEEKKELEVNVLYKNGLLEYKYYLEMKNRYSFDEYEINLNAFDFKVFQNTISGKFYSFDENNQPIDEIYLIKTKNEKTGITSVKNYTKTIKNIFKKNRSDYNNISNENEKKLLTFLSSFDIVPIYSFTSLLKKLSLNIEIINDPDLLNKILKINYDY